MHAVHELLVNNITLRLFAVIGLGYLLGQVKIRRFRLGVAAVLFVGLALGSWDAAAFELPAVVSVIGLTLFVYTIGLASGPSVYQALTSPRGLRLSLLTVLAVAAGGLTTLGLAVGTRLTPEQAAGLFAGGLTNTPALAAELELCDKLAASGARVDREGPAVGYAVAYPFGVLGVFLVMGVLTARADVQAELEVHEKSLGLPHGPVLSVDYTVTRLKPNGNQLEAGWVTQQCGLVISRRLHQTHQELVESPETLLCPGDVVVAVGTAEMHAAGAPLLGEVATRHLERELEEITYRRFFVSNKEIVGKQLAELPLESMHAKVTRVRRGDVELPATPGFKLLAGDVVRVVSRIENVEALSHFFGDSLEEIAATDFLSVSLGMVLGVLAGSLPLPLGSAPYPTLGVAGGTLLVALALGKIGRTGRIVWTMSLEANLAIRHMGLLFFLACVGIKAGGQFKAALLTDGVMLVGSGSLITLASVLTLAAGMRWWLREDLVSTLGVIAGAHTQPACLAYGENLLGPGGQGVSVGYAAVFPVAMIAKILVGTTLLSWLL